MANDEINYGIDRCLDMLGRAYVPDRYYNTKDLEYRFWFRTLYTDLCSALEFKNIPKTWPKNFLKLCIFLRGYVAVFADKKYGLTFQPCNLRDLNWYFQPKYACVSNAYYGNGNFYHEYEIGDKCELLCLTEDYLGIADHVDYFAQKLANLSVAINMACATAKIPAVFQCKTEQEKQAIEAIWDDSQSGKPITITLQKNDSNQVLASKDIVSVVFAELKKNYIGTELLADLQTVLDMWYSFIGYPTTVDKNSHILNQEADFQFAQSTSKVKTWTSCLQSGLDKINDMFKTEMEVHYACENMSSGDGEASSETEQIDSGRDDASNN